MKNTYEKEKCFFLAFNEMEKRLPKLFSRFRDCWPLFPKIEKSLILGNTYGIEQIDMLIFFDWDTPDGKYGPQDAHSDHVGIVEKVENGIVYTIEGNCQDECKRNQYPVGWYEIMGYGGVR